MGEAVPYLMRSISQPLSASCGFKEGDPLKALTTSVSFGRFMTEQLDWEKWSSFSHNRTLEDVQKYSRPGAVAEKKAFFEAYYKNFGAKKSTRKENKPPKFSDIDENKQSNRVTELEIQSNEDVCLPSTTNLGFSETRNVDDIMSSTCQVEQEKTSTENVSSNSGLTTSNKDVCLPCTNLVYSGTGNVDGVVSEEPGTDLVLSQLVDGMDDGSGVELKISSKDGVCLPRTNLVFSENEHVDVMITSNGQMEREKTSTENVPSKKQRFQDKLSVQTKTESSFAKSSSRTAPIAEIQHKQAARDSVDKKTKKSVRQSLHLSVKFPASLNKNLNLKAASKPNDKPSQQALTKVSAVNEVKKNSQVLPRQEKKRHSEELIATTKKPRSTTVFSSFSFRSDERAAKRREFFQKLEENRKTKKTETTLLQPKLKEKGRGNNRKWPWSTVLDAKPGDSEKINIIQKIPTKFGKKNFIEINKKNLCRSMACLSSKKLHDSGLMLKK